RLDLHSFPTRRSSDLDDVELPKSLASSGCKRASSASAEGAVDSSYPRIRAISGDHSTLPLVASSTKRPINDDCSVACCRPSYQRSEEHTSELQSRENL